MEVTTVGLDLAKRVFQVHAVNAEGAIVLRKALRRAQMLPFFAKLPPCLIGIEACGTSTGVDNLASLGPRADPPGA